MENFPVSGFLVLRLVAFFLHLAVAVPAGCVVFNRFFVFFVVTFKLIKVVNWKCGEVADWKMIADLLFYNLKKVPTAWIPDMIELAFGPFIYNIQTLF